MVAASDDGLTTGDHGEANKEGEEEDGREGGGKKKEKAKKKKKERQEGDAMISRGRETSLSREAKETTEQTTPGGGSVVFGAAKECEANGY